MCLMPYANNKGADQPAQMCSLISTFVVPCLDSMYTCYILSFKILASFCNWAGWFDAYVVTNSRRQVFSWLGSDGTSGSFRQTATWSASWQTNKMTVRPTKTQISLGIRPVWSESLLCAQWVAKDTSFLHVDSEDSDQTGRMPRLI